MAHRRNNHARSPNSFSHLAHFMNPTTTSNAHSLSLLRHQAPQSFSPATSSRRYGQDLEPIYTPAAKKYTSSEGYDRDPNNIPTSSPSSLYETGSVSLCTEELATRMGEDEITSLERIKKRNGALKLGDLETPARSSFEVASSPSTALATTPVSVNRRNLQMESSPWVPPPTPTGFYLQPQASATTNTLPLSGDRRRTILSRKRSSMSPWGRVTGDIWEQASEDKENIDETQSLPGSRRKGTVSRGFRGGIDKIMGKLHEDKLMSSPIDYVAKALARRQDLSSLPQDVYGSSPLVTSTATLSNTQSHYTHSSRDEFPPSVNHSDEYIEYNHPDLWDCCTTLFVLSSSRPSSRSHFTPSPLFDRFPPRSLSLRSRCDRKIDIGCSPPALSVVQPVKVLAKPPVSPAANMWLSNSQKPGSLTSFKPTGKMSFMAPTEIYAQAPILVSNNPDLILPREVTSSELIPVSTCLTLMSTKSLFSRGPVPTTEKLAIMTPTTTCSQIPVPADSPMFYFVVSIMLPIFLSTTQALAFALHHVGEEMSYELVKEIFKGWFVGAVVGMVMHAFGRGTIRVPEDMLYFLAWVIGLLVRTVRNVMEKFVGGFRAGKGNDI